MQNTSINELFEHYTGSNSEMKIKAQSDLSDIKRKLQIEIAMLRDILSSEELMKFDQLQSIWENYCDALQSYERSRFAGATNSALSAAIACIVATHHRFEAVRNDLRERELG